MIVSYNMTSVTDGGAVVNTDHLFDTDFSGADYVCIGSNNLGGGAVSFDGTTGSAGGITSLSMSATPTATDSVDNYAAFFGDQ